MDLHIFFMSTEWQRITRMSKCWVLGTQGLVENFFFIARYDKERTVNSVRIVY